MASNTQKLKRVANWKDKKMGKVRKRKNNSQGTTPVFAIHKVEESPIPKLPEIKVAK